MHSGRFDTQEVDPPHIAESDTTKPPSQQTTPRKQNPPLSPPAQAQPAQVRARVTAAPAA